MVNQRGKQPTKKNATQNKKDTCSTKEQELKKPTKTVESEINKVDDGKAPQKTNEVALNKKRGRKPKTADTNKSNSPVEAKNNEAKENVTNQKSKIVNKNNSNVIKTRQKTPFNPSSKIRTHELLESEESDDERDVIERKYIEKMKDSIKGYSLKRSVEFLEQLKQVNDNENEELQKQLNSMKKGTWGVGIPGDLENIIDNKILQKYFGMTIEKNDDPRSKGGDDGHTFTFQFNNRMFAFSLKTDPDLSDSFHYTFLDSRNVELTSFMRTSKLSFKKHLTIRFFNEVFLSMSKI